MNIFKLKQTTVAIWLAFALLFGSGILSNQIGLDIVPTTHACGLGANAGGGCV